MTLLKRIAVLAFFGAAGAGAGALLGEVYFLKARQHSYHFYLVLRQNEF